MSTGPPPGQNRSSLPRFAPTRISVTEVDRLKADPYAFYARRVLGLAALDPIDADPSGRVARHRGPFDPGSMGEA